MKVSFAAPFPTWHWLAIAAALSFGVESAHATIGATLPSIEKVMSGASSSGNDQVWIRVNGQPAGVPSDCVWSSYSLFYVPDDVILNRDRALSLLLTAKVANQPVSISFDVDTSQADFWGYGISKCLLRRITVGG